VSYHSCDHLKEDGVPCGSPALRGEKLCFFHHRDHKRHQYADAVIRRADVLGPRLPRMKSLGEIQSALYKVMIAILDFRVSPRRAGARLFDLQQASLAFRKPHRKRN